MLAAILLSWILTYFIPQGTYERRTNPETGQTYVLDASYERVSVESPGIFDLMLAIPEGISGRADLLVLILLMGGCFFVIEQTGALGNGLQMVADLLQGREGLGLIVLAFLFAAAGATIGLQEEIIALIPILILFCRSMGYNAYVAVAASFGSAVMGAAFSPMNPFAVVLAQKEAQIPLLSGAEYRLLVFVVAFVAWVFFLYYYSKKHRIEKEALSMNRATLTWRMIAVLSILIITFSVVTYGLLTMDWGLMEISACFFVTGILSGLLSKMGLNRTVLTYVDGMKEMIFATLVIGLANSISILLKQGMVMDSIIYYLFTPMEGLPKSLSALGMMAGQALLHFPVSSYTGQAVLTMPILVPLADLVGISRQVTVLAYQYGAVNMDFIVPTNGALMAVLAVAEIPYNKWFRFIWKPLLIILSVASAALVLAVVTGF